MPPIDGLPLVSVIVPVYKVEAYLPQCVDSLLAQTYGNIEIVLVDDGSPDRCGEICDAYAARDSRVHALRKENGGLSDARNFGLRHASGELISFVDSDDFVSPVFIETLYYAMKKCGTRISAVPGGHDFRDGDDVSLVEDISAVAPFVQAPLRPSAAIRLMLYQAMATGAPWRLYERSVLGEDPFPVGLLYEDLATTYRFVHRAGDVAVVNSRDLYAYRLRDTSIIRQAYSANKAHSALVIADQLYHDICEWYPELTAAAASRCFSVCRMVFAQVPMGATVNPEIKRDRDELWKVIKRYRTIVLHDQGARKRERLAAAVACLGESAFTVFCNTARKAGLLR